LQDAILAEIYQVEHSDRIACAIRDVRELMVTGGIIRKAISPAADQEQRQQQASSAPKREGAKGGSAWCRIHPRLLGSREARHCAASQAMYPN
jgi:hypothetical protein